MKLLDLVVKEYLSIVNAVLEKGEPIENNRIVIDKEYFKELLEKYHYMKFNQKTKIYKDLNLIIHDKNNYTMPVKDTELKRTVRKVVLNYNSYTTIKNLYESDINL
jgi:hypothetical protein